MKIMIITSSPNKNGLTASCGEQARLGASSAGAETILVSLNDLNIGKCEACNNGWGTCKDTHICQTKDDFQQLHSDLKDIDGFILVTPVYWREISESAKAFIDRLRRCEAIKKEDQYLTGKPFICIAAAGGSGNGYLSSLATMELFLDQVKGQKLDFIGVTRKNKEYKLKTIQEAASLMAESLK